MSEEDLRKLAQKIKDGTVTPEEEKLFFSQINARLKDLTNEIRGDV